LFLENIIIFRIQTIIYLPRQEYEKSIKYIDELNIYKDYDYYKYKYLQLKQIYIYIYMDYYNKYFKYKTKYLNLKYNNKQYGGTGDDKAIQVVFSEDDYKANLYKILNEKGAETLTVVELIFIFGDNTSSDFFKKYNKLINKEVISYDDLHGQFLKMMEYALSEARDDPLFVRNPGKHHSSIENIVDYFINNYSIYLASAKNSVIKRSISNSILHTNFNSLFNKINFLFLNGSILNYTAENLISNYLFFNLLSKWFLDYQVDFTNYYKMFNSIQQDKNFISIIVYTDNTQLCLFICDGKQLYYNYEKDKLFVSDWTDILNTEDELYITPDGKLINKTEYTIESQGETFKELEYYRVLYVTVITKWTRSNAPSFSQQLNVDRIIQLKNETESECVAFLKEIDDKVLQNALTRIYSYTYGAKAKLIDKSFLEDNDFIVAQYDLSMYYIEQMKDPAKGYRKLVTLASYKYQPIIDELCKNREALIEHKIETTAQIEKWCSIKDTEIELRRQRERVDKQLRVEKDKIAEIEKIQQTNRASRGEKLQELGEKSLMFSQKVSQYMTGTEVMLIFGDTTGFDLFEHFRTKIPPPKKIQYPEYKYVKDAIRESGTRKNESYKLFLELFFGALPTDTPNHTHEENIKHIENIFIDRYIYLFLFPFKQIRLKLGDLNDASLNIKVFDDQFGKLFDHIKFLLKGLSKVYNNVIDEYLFFNLFSICFLNYQVNFTNYYKEFNKSSAELDKTKLIGVILNGYKFKLYLFICNNIEYCYNYNDSSISECNWFELLKNSQELYINTDGTLVNTIDDKAVNITKWVRIFYITVVTKFEPMDETPFLQILQLTNIKQQLTEDNHITFLKAINDKVLQYILTDIYLSTTHTPITDKIKDYLIFNNTFAPALYAASNYYLPLGGEALDVAHKWLLNPGSYMYPPAMNILCNSYNKTNPQISNWCTNLAEEKRLADAAELQRLVEVKRLAEEQKRLAEVEEQKRLAEEQKRLAEEQKRLAEEQKRLAEEAEQKRLAEVEEQKRLAEDAAKQQRLAEEAAKNAAEEQQRLANIAKETTKYKLYVCVIDSDGEYDNEECRDA
jgi:hypothetical protein